MITYSIVVVSEVFKMKIWKAALVFIIVMLPLFVIGNGFWQVR